MSALVMGVRVVRTPFFIPHTWCAGIAWRHRRYRLMNFTKKAVFTWHLYAWGQFFYTCRSVESDLPHLADHNFDKNLRL